MLFFVYQNQTTDKTYEHQYLNIYFVYESKFYSVTKPNICGFLFLCVYIEIKNILLLLFLNYRNY